MQADMYLRIAAGGFSLNAIGGVRGAARDVAEPTFADRLISREHYLMYQKDDASPYVRIGRFFPLFGLRLPDHTTYVRRFLGFHTLEESYGLAGGIYQGTWEVHAGAFMPVPIETQTTGEKAYGGTVYAEHSLREETAAIALQARVAIADEDNRYTVGAVGKMYLEGAKLQLLAELDYQLQTIDTRADTVTRSQLAGYLGATHFLTQGVMLTAAYERWEPDLIAGDVSRDAVSATVQYFPYAHIEALLTGKVEAQGEDLDHPGSYAMLMLHYYL
jgi:hypothetical protein